MTDGSDTAVHGFADDGAGPARLAAALGVPSRAVALHRFPDGESLVRIAEPAHHAILYRAFDRPNDTLVEAALAASALRDGGARRVTLVAPYLPYMRQDIAFRPGEAVSQLVVGAWLAGHFDAVVAVEPHLHRTDDLALVFPGTEARAVGAGPALAGALSRDGVPATTVILGPDEESAPLAEATALPLGLDWAVGEKTRTGDHKVAVVLPDRVDLRDRPVAVVDDVVSSGTTILRCAEQAFARGAAGVEILAVHALYPPDIAAAIAAAGIGRVRSCDGIAHPSNAIGLASLLAQAVESG